MDSITIVWPEGTPLVTSFPTYQLYHFSVFHDARVFIFLWLLDPAILSVVCILSHTAADSMVVLASATIATLLSEQLCAPQDCHHFSLKYWSSFPVATHSPFPVATHSPFPVATHSPFPVTKHSPFPVAKHSPFPVVTHSSFPVAKHSPFPVATHSPFTVATPSLFPYIFFPLDWVMLSYLELLY
jgi:hypothetical protein